MRLTLYYKRAHNHFISCALAFINGLECLSISFQHNSLHHFFFIFLFFQRTLAQRTLSNCTLRPLRSRPREKTALFGNGMSRGRRKRDEQRGVPALYQAPARSRAQSHQFYPLGNCYGLFFCWIMTALSVMKQTNIHTLIFIAHKDSMVCRVKQ